MPHADFVHLRVHSAYSLSEGAIKLNELVALCQRHAMPAVAVTDTGNLFGALEFAIAASEAGVQPIIGCQIAIAREDHPGNHAQGLDQLVLLVQDETGYRNLVHLVSRSFLDGEPGAAPQVAPAWLDGATDGLIAFTGGPSGRVGRLLAEGQDDAAEAALGWLKTLFPGRLYVELMRHGLPEEARIEARLIDLADARDLPLVATNECFFADESKYEAHDALLCIAGGVTVERQDRRHATPDHRFKTAAEMRKLFADLPEAIDNTLAVARRCAFMPQARQPILPVFPVPAGRSEAEELRLRSAAGLEARLGANVRKPGMDDEAFARAARPHRQRLAFELEVIAQMGYAGYFLIVADFIQWAKRQGIPVGPGRGSGAGSVVAWALTITDLDPLRWGLLFERFLNPERVSMPDFDIDFCQERRDEVIRYVQDKYGRDRVAQIITFGTLQARACLRDVGRVLQMPYAQVDRLCKLIPSNPANPVTLAQAIEGEPLLRNARDGDETVARLLDIAMKLEGLYRHASTHAAGVVIGDWPLDELVPLYRDPRSTMPVTQFSMKYVELAGLVKFDFLGLKTLSVLARAVALLAERGVAVDIEHLPLDDPGAYGVIAHGDTIGIFQMESSGVRDALRKLKPDRFEDIIAVVALYRPGPMDNIPRYIACKHGVERPDYLHPSLEGVLKETFGIMIYQEQVMQIAQVLSGYSLGGADLLRRAMGKKIKSEMEAQRRNFIDGAVARDVPEDTAALIFEQVNKFAGYGFNKSHAAAYALVAYQTAWMKVHHPVEFFAASMSFDLANTDRLALYRQELERMKIRLLPPDINRSRADFSVEPCEDGALAVRYALAAIKKVGAAAIDAVVEERSAGGPFKDLTDLARRLGPRVLNKGQLENLIAAGAFDSLNRNRRQCHEAAEAILRHAALAASDRESRQVSLFGDDAGSGAGLGPDAIPLPAVEDWPIMERLHREFLAVGSYMSAHPLDTYGASLRRLEAVRYADLNSWLDGRMGSRAKVAGIVIDCRERTSARGNRFAVAQLSDPSGVFEMTFFAEALAASRDLLEPGRLVLATVETRREGEDLKLFAQKVEPLDEAVARAAIGLKVYLRDPGPIAGLKQVLDREKPGRGRVKLVLDLDGRSEVEVALPGAWAIHAATRAAIQALPGVTDVREI